MYKRKTHSGSSKRFKVTSTGKVMRKQAFKNHILDWKTKKQKRHLSNMCLVHKTDMDRVKHMLVL